jgi:Na+/melibiose symporter-like transporter
VGSILASGAVRGALNLTGNTSWTLPIWLQLVFPSLVILFIWFAPESPRWLYVHGKVQAAKDALTRWHGYGNPDSAWVKLQLSEYEEFLELDGADKRWWDYSALFKTRASRYRIACNVVFSIFAQWAGNGVLTYFLPAVLKTAGYKGEVQQANINLAYACFQFAFALIGAAFVEKVGPSGIFLVNDAIADIRAGWPTPNVPRLHGRLHNRMGGYDHRISPVPSSKLNLFHSLGQD